MPEERSPARRTALHLTFEAALRAVPEAESTAMRLAFNAGFISGLEVGAEYERGR
jgi:hypothetical protein